MRRSELKELHYITHIKNVPSIWERGILSHERAEKIRHTSVAKQEVQARRKGVVVPGGLPLHKYANLYICGRNPMLYLLKAEHKELCVLRLSPDVLDLPDVVVSDMNAAAVEYVRFAPAPRGLAIVDRELAFARYWTHQDPIEKMRRKSAKCAEVLVPHRVEPKYLVGVYVSCEESLQVFRDLGVPLQASVNPELFFR